jgi:orotate phosphoribosyltransferase
MYCPAVPGYGEKLEQYKQEFITFMVRAKVLTFGEFITKSGRKSPFFINTGNYKTGEQIARLGGFYAEALQATLGNDFDVLFGPAYKGIPLVISTAIALFEKYHRSVPYCFNRKEIKRHGEGGGLIGHPVARNERIVIVDDVVTAGTSVKESVELLSSVAQATFSGVVVSVDRMERGATGKSALAEIRELFGMKTLALVTLDEIVEYLFNREIDGTTVIDSGLQRKIDEYRTQYG